MTMLQDGDSGILAFARSLGDGDSELGWERLAALFARAPDKSLALAEQRDPSKEGWESVGGDELKKAIFGRVDDPGAISPFSGIHKWYGILKPKKSKAPKQLTFGKKEGKVTYRLQGTLDDNMELMKALASTSENFAVRVGFYSGKGDFQWLSSPIMERGDLIGVGNVSTFERSLRGLLDAITQNEYTHQEEEDESLDPEFPVFDLTLWDPWTYDPRDYTEDYPFELDYSEEEIPF